MVINWSLFVSRGIFLIISVLLLVGQVVAQERGVAGPQLVCIRSQVNPDNDTEDLTPAISDNHIVWVGYADGEDGEVFAMNRETGVVTQITDNDHEELKPQVDGEYVVWQYENPDNSTWDIALHNLATGMTQFLNPNTSEDWEPMIEDNIVVWSQDVAVNRVKYYNTATDTLSNIGGGFGGNKYWAYAINNGRILYRHIQPVAGVDHYYLYVYDVATSTSTLVSGDLPTADGKYDAMIDGDVVIWENQTAGQPASSIEIYAYNLLTDSLTRVTNNNQSDIEPAIRGNDVAYISQTDTTHEMRLYDLQTGTDTLLESSPEIAYYDPFIEGEMVAWSSIYGIYVYHMDTTRVVQVTDYAEAYALVLRDNRIFWSGWQQGEQDGDIFMADCGFTPEIVSQPQDVEIASGGTAMLSVVAEVGETLNYQWFEGGDTDSSTPIAGATSATFVTPPLTASTKFWVRVGNRYGTLESRRATVVVASELEASATPTLEASSTLQPGVTETLTPDTTGTPTLEVTSTPTLTPTPTVPGSVQILPNTSFELDVENDKIPDGWSAKGTQLKNADKLKRNKLNEDGSVKAVAYSGESAFMFKGNPAGEKSKIQYKLSDFAVITDGMTLEFSVYVNRFNITPGETIGKIKINFSDGSKETLQLSAPETQAYTSVSDSLVVDLEGRTIEKFKVEFSTNLSGGKFLIDNASLLVVPILIGEGESSLLPLP